MPPKLRRQLSEKQSAKLRRVFDEHDAGRKGCLSFAEFRGLLQSLGKEVSVERVQEMILAHARAHHEEHFGEQGFMEEDIEHISFELFCEVVKGAAARRDARKEQDRIVKEGGQAADVDAAVGANTKAKVNGQVEVENPDPKPKMPPKLRRQLSEKQSAKLRRVFDEHDAGRKGCLSFAEFRGLLQSLGKEVSVERVQEMILAHARAHHEEHFGEQGFVEEDIEHISFELFCEVVKGAAARRDARKEQDRKVKVGGPAAGVDAPVAEVNGGGAEVVVNHAAVPTDPLEFTFSKDEPLHIEVGRALPVTLKSGDDLGKSFNSWDKDEGGVVVYSVKPESKVPGRMQWYKITAVYSNSDASYHCDTTHTASVKAFMDIVRHCPRPLTLRLAQAAAPTTNPSKDESSPRLDLDLIDNLVINVAKPGKLGIKFKDISGTTQGACFAVRALEPDSPVLSDTVTAAQLVGRPLVMIGATDLVADHIDATKTLDILKQALENRPCDLVLGPCMVIETRRDDGVREASINSDSAINVAPLQRRGKRSSITFNFPETPKLQRQLSTKQVSKLRRIFDEHDTGSKNYLTFSEFQGIMNSLGKPVSTERCQAMILAHARQHHEEHYGEKGFVEEDVEHVSFELFCEVVKGAAARKDARKQQRATDVAAGPAIKKSDASPRSKEQKPGQELESANGESAKEKEKQSAAEDALREKIKRQQNQYRILAEKQEHLENLLLSKNTEVAQLRENQKHASPTAPKEGNSRVANSPLITRVDRDKGGLFGPAPVIVKRKRRKARQTAGSAAPKGSFSDFPPATANFLTSMLPLPACAGIASKLSIRITRASGLKKPALAPNPFDVGDEDLDSDYDDDEKASSSEMAQFPVAVEVRLNGRSLVRSKPAMGKHGDPVWNIERTVWIDRRIDLRESVMTFWLSKTSKGGGRGDTGSLGVVTLQRDLMASLLRAGDSISDKSRPLREPSARGKLGVKTGQGSLLVGFSGLDVPDFDGLEYEQHRSRHGFGEQQQLEPERGRGRRRHQPTTFLARADQARLDRLRIMSGKDQMKVLTLMRTLLSEMCEEDEFGESKARARQTTVVIGDSLGEVQKKSPFCDAFDRAVARAGIKGGPPPKLVMRHFSGSARKMLLQLHRGSSLEGMDDVLVRRLLDLEPGELEKLLRETQEHLTAEETALSAIILGLAKFQKMKKLRARRPNGGVKRRGGPRMARLKKGELQERRGRTLTVAEMKKHRMETEVPVKGTMKKNRAARGESGASPERDRGQAQVLDHMETYNYDETYDAQQEYDEAYEQQQQQQQQRQQWQQQQWQQQQQQQQQQDVMYFDDNIMQTVGAEEKEFDEDNDECYYDDEGYFEEEWAGAEAAEAAQDDTKYEPEYYLGGDSTTLELGRLGQGVTFDEEYTNPELAFVQQHHTNFFQSTLPDGEFSGVLVYEGGVPTQRYDEREIKMGSTGFLQDLLMPATMSPNHGGIQTQRQKPDGGSGGSLPAINTAGRCNQRGQHQASGGDGDLDLLLSSGAFEPPSEGFSGVVVYERGAQREVHTETTFNSNARITDEILKRNPRSVDTELTKRVFDQRVDAMGKAKKKNNNENEFGNLRAAEVEREYPLPTGYEDLMKMRSGALL